MSNILRKCPMCRERQLGLVTTHHETSVYHDDKEYVVTFPDLVIFSCSVCGNRIVPMDSEERLMVALRQAAVLLTPDEIRDNRVRVGLSQEKLASELGVTEDTLSRWEAGLLIQSRSLDNDLRAYFSLPTPRTNHSKVEKPILPALDSTPEPVLS